MKNRQYNQGQAAIVLAVFLIGVSTAIIGGFVGPVVRESRTATDYFQSKQGYFLSEASLEDVVYRLKTGQAVSSVEELILNGSRATTTISDVAGTKEVIASSSINQVIRKIKTVLTVGSGATFSLGLQSGQGGIYARNNPTIIGSVYSNGRVWGDNKFDITGDVVSAGSTGEIDNVNVGGKAYAHTIRDSNVTSHAYYVNLISTTVGGSFNGNSADQPIIPLPISDETIALWESQAEAGGVQNCTGTYTISTNTTIGPRKYTCNLLISGNPDITLTGPIWVTGNFQVDNNAKFYVSGAQSGKSMAIIADNSSNRISSSRILLDNNAQFFGSGTGSYITLISQNNSAELGGSVQAIDINNNATGDYFLYAGHGLVFIDNNANFNQITAYQINIDNNAIVTYESGMANMVFSSGPGGTWNIGDWFETE